MTEKIEVGDVYDKNLNFLIGSGASNGLFPTLALSVKDEEGVTQTLETLATRFADNNDPRLVPLLMHYYQSCIRPAQVFTATQASGNVDKERVLENYDAFLSTLLQILQRRKPFDKRCNIFTTNYDGCFSLAADNLLEKANVDFVLNDGSRGFSNRYLQPRNFNTYISQTGIFERSVSSIPQINLIHLHGSVYWQRKEGNILVDYRHSSCEELLTDDARASLAPFSQTLMNDALSVGDLADVPVSEQVKEAFMEGYKKLPIVNPTKWKFHETVFEEHYYQMLRMLSYELEKPNSVLITFGFSFADEHILSLVKRSLSNPSLQVFVCCYDQPAFNQMSSTFKIYRNVRCVHVESGALDFTEFNASVFTLSTTSDVVDPTPAETGIAT